MKYIFLLALNSVAWLSYEVFRAEVDGQVETAEIALRAEKRNREYLVETFRRPDLLPCSNLSAGRHTIIFSYWPPIHVDIPTCPRRP